MRISHVCRLHLDVLTYIGSIFLRPWLPCCEQLSLHAVPCGRRGIRTRSQSAAINSFACIWPGHGGIKWLALMQFERRPLYCSLYCLLYCRQFCVPRRQAGAHQCGSVHGPGVLQSGTAVHCSTCAVLDRTCTLLDSTVASYTTMKFGHVPSAMALLLRAVVLACTCKRTAGRPLMAAGFPAVSHVPYTIRSNMWQPVCCVVLRCAVAAASRKVSYDSACMHCILAAAAASLLAVRTSFPKRHASWLYCCIAAYCRAVCQAVPPPLV